MNVVVVCEKPRENTNLDMGSVPLVHEWLLTKRTTPTTSVGVLVQEFHPTRLHTEPGV